MQNKMITLRVNLKQQPGFANTLINRLNSQLPFNFKGVDYIVKSTRAIENTNKFMFYLKVIS